MCVHALDVLPVVCEPPHRRPRPGRVAVVATLRRERRPRQRRGLARAAAAVAGRSAAAERPLRCGGLQGACEAAASGASESGGGAAVC